MKNDDIQEEFFNVLKRKSASGSGFAEELAEILCVSKDSAYRRLRGETPLQLNEVQKLCLHYEVSVDNLFHTESDQVTFSNRIISTGKYSLRNYFETLLQDLTQVLTHRDVSVVFAAKDIPPFYFFNYPNLTKFRLYFWRQNLEGTNGFNNSPFSEFTGDKELMGMAGDMYNKYLQIPSIEIWSDEAVGLFTRCIDYYYEASALSKTEAIQLYEEFLEMLSQIRLMAEQGKKFRKGASAEGMPGTFQLYYNEVTISDNTVYFELDGEPVTYLVYNMINILYTEDEGFCTHIKGHLNNIIKKSTLISSVSEKVRNKYFNEILGQVEKRLESYK